MDGPASSSYTIPALRIGLPVQFLGSTPPTVTVELSGSEEEEEEEEGEGEN